MARFIVIDDFPDTAAALAMVATVLGHEALPLTSGVKIVREAVAWRANVIVNDIQMPECDGFEVARLVRAHLPMVLLVGFSGGVQPDRHPDVSLFDLFFQKPIGMPEVELIAKVADGRGSTPRP